MEQTENRLWDGSDLASRSPYGAVITAPPSTSTCPSSQTCLRAAALCPSRTLDEVGKPHCLSSPQLLNGTYWCTQDPPPNNVFTRAQVRPVKMMMETIMSAARLPPSTLMLPQVEQRDGCDGPQMSGKKTPVA